ncbi:MAG: FAD-dependent oxidoreductase [Syntrophobacterales bacterium]|jgi:alkyl hydroperoxide reductase subunit F|nr:FAD-dependent oxidoreductase [Syntrophobacterales bacterium]
MSQDLYDTIIIGGGPAGAAAAVYAARKRLKALLITEGFGGQSSVSACIENWIGEPAITGMALAAKLKKHVEAQKDLEIKSPEKAIAVTEKPGCIFEVKTDKNGLYRAKSVIVASGGRRKRLNLPGEKEFAGKGVAFCSTCDAPFFLDKDVAVVGSGNSALETVIDLETYARKIFLLIHHEEPKGDPVILERAEKSKKLEIIRDAEIKEIIGDKGVTGLRYEDGATGKVKELAVQGVFVAIGSAPNSDLVKNIVDTNQGGEILVDHLTAKTSRRGLFAAGDVTNDPFKQNNISAGDGVRAALGAYHHILNIQRHSPCFD